MRGSGLGADIEGNMEFFHSCRFLVCYWAALGYAGESCGEADSAVNDIYANHNMFTHIRLVPIYLKSKRCYRGIHSTAIIDTTVLMRNIIIRNLIANLFTFLQYTFG